MIVFKYYSLFVLSLFLSLISNVSFGQTDEDALFIKSIHDEVLKYGECYSWLTHISEKIGGRLAGSPESEEAIEYTKKVLENLADTVYLQECTVPYWTRGRRSEIVKITHLPGGPDMNLSALALGNSIGTGKNGIEAEIVEVRSLDEVKKLGIPGIAGKIVFYNRPMDVTQINTFRAYGGAADQRVNGPAVAAEYGAIGVVIRSLGSSTDRIPHTGVTRYKEGVKAIPAVAISTRDADALQRFIKLDGVQLYIETHCEMIDEAKLSYNVIAEIKGKTDPEKIIIVGGHLDSWDVGGGAHDDGAGCVHSMEVLRTLKALNYRPNHTLRCVLFMNEENGLGGGTAYADSSNVKNEFHLAALESDAGGFTPRGFTFDANDEYFSRYFKQVSEWSSLLDPYHLWLSKGGSGADISRLKSQNGLLIGFRPDSQRYFDFHHTEADRIDAVNERELKLGAAAITSLIYLIDKYSLKSSTE